MGTRVTVVSTGQIFEPTDLSVTEDVATSDISVTDGGIPLITMTLPANIDFLRLINQAVRVESTTHGSIEGVITELSVSQSNMPTCTLNTKLNPLIRLVRAKPFSGKLSDLIRYYLTMVKMPTGSIQFEKGFVDQDVVVQGFEDVLWNKIVKFQTVYRFEIAVVGDYVSVRPWKTRTAEVGHFIDKRYDYTALPISRSVEMSYFSNRKITHAIVWPPKRQNSEATTIQFDARSNEEFELQLSASLYSLKQPVCVSSITNDYNGTGSRYTVIDKDGAIVSPTDWAKWGGRVVLEIGPDSTTVKVKVTGPDYFPRSPYKLQYAPITIQSDGDKNVKKPAMDLAFNSLFIVGTGVAYDEQVVTIMTGAPESEVVEDVGVQVTDPTISSIKQLYDAAMPILDVCTGGRLTMSGTVARVNQRGDTGEIQNLPYGTVEDLTSPQTYGTMEDVTHAGENYGEVEDYYSRELVFDFANQAYGNSAGARLYDPTHARWFRITSATITNTGITFTAEDDLTYGDVEEWADAWTYGDIEDNVWKNLTYKVVEFQGMKEHE